MSHGEVLPRIGYKLDYIRDNRPRWYGPDEQRLAMYERGLDDQIRRIQKPLPKKKPERFKLPKRFSDEEPEGIRAAERGR